MTTYFEDFSSVTDNVAVPDWTARWSGDMTIVGRDEATASNGKAARITHAGSSDARAGLTWNVIDSDAHRDNVEIAIRWKGYTSSSGLRRARIVARGSGATDTDMTSYAGGLSYRAGEHQRRLVKYVNGSFTDINSSLVDEVGQNVWQRIRFRANGSDLKLKTWLDSTDEPAGWDVEETDSSISGAGWVGFFLLDQGAAADVDWIGVGTDGDEACRVPLP